MTRGEGDKVSVKTCVTLMTTCLSGAKIFSIDINFIAFLVYPCCLVGKVSRKSTKTQKIFLCAFARDFLIANRRV